MRKIQAVKWFFAALALFGLGVASLASAQFFFGVQEGDGSVIADPFNNQEGSGALPVQPGVADPLILSLSPQYPKPGDIVIVEVKTTVFDLQQADIGWMEDGKLLESGLAYTKHTLVAGSTGSVKVVTAIVRDINGSIYEKSIEIRPAVVDVVWESSTSIPVFYKGKALYSQLGKVRVVALPELTDKLGRRLDPTELYFTWSENNEVQGDQSGYGRDVLIIDQPIFRTPYTVSVVIKTRDGLISARGETRISTSQPLSLIYENSPLYGILFNQAVRGGFTLDGPEVTLEAVPYFFNAVSVSSLNFSWSVNYQNVDAFTSSFLTVRNIGTDSGNAPVSVNIVNPQSLAEAARSAFTVNFGQ